MLGPNDFEIIVVAPTGRDGHLICELLVRVGLTAHNANDCEAACRQAEAGVGAIIVADEVLNPQNTAVLVNLVRRQPTWSDLPIVVLTGRGQVTFHSEARRKSREPLGNVILVERPVRPETLVSTLKTAIRARSRQYEVRDHLRQQALAAEALRKSEKLAIAGRLAATIAHEINNPLEAVINLHYLMATAPSLEVAKRYLADADQELARVAEITTHTLRFHRESTVPSDVNLASILDTVLKLYERRMAASNVTIDRRFDSNAVIVGFAGELRQLFANLISNALDSMPRGGRLHVRVALATEPSNSHRRGIRLVVADTGSGIPRSIRDKIMEAFVSTKQDTGTGLGLWVSSHIVQKHGGSLRFKSQAGRGTVFSIFLPLTLPRTDSTTELDNPLTTNASTTPASS